MEPLKPKSIDPKKFKKLTPVSVKGHYYRSVHIDHQNDILSTQGSVRYGGRYNPRREFGVLYAGESQAVCQAEINRRLGAGFAAPWVICRLKISLTKVLDLTNPANLKRLGIKRKDLIMGRTEGGWNLTQEIARLSYRSGYGAILAPSATSKGNNLIIFDQHIDAAKINSYKHLR